jgi:hypothetical protein
MKSSPAPPSITSAAEVVHPADPSSLGRVEGVTGVPGFFLRQVFNPTAGTTPASVPGTYRIEFSADIGKTVHAPGTQATFTLNSARLADQPAVIPLGDINGDGHPDFIAAVQDYAGSWADNPNPALSQQYPLNPADALLSSFARIYFGNGSTTNAVSLRLPAPVLAPSYFLSQSIFASPGDYNGDGIDDIAIAVTRTNTFQNLAVPFANEGVYVIFGRAAGFTGTLDVLANANVTIRGFAQPATNFATLDFRLSVAPVDMNDDGFDDLVVGNSATGTNLQGAVHVFNGRANWSTFTDRQVFGVDFSTSDGSAPSSDGFVIDNTNPAGLVGQWHASVGRNALANHTAGGAMYFGAGETASVNGTYDTVVNNTRSGRLTSPSISLAGLQSARLSFKYLMQTQAIPAGYASTTPLDRVRVLVERNNTGTYLPLEVNSRTGVRDAGAANQMVIDGVLRPALLMDPASGWTTATFDLSAYAGQSVRVRFEFVTNTSDNAYEGMYVDDVTVTGATLSPANASATFSGLEFFGQGEMLGASVSSAGDFNADGREDLVVVRAAGGGGATYLVYGRPPTGPAFTSVPLSSFANVTLTAVKPFAKYGARPAGDLNGDGFDDFLIAPALPSSLQADGLPPGTHVVFGRAVLAGSLDLFTLPGRVGTGRDGGWVGLGDVNGDGFDDLGAANFITRPGVVDPALLVRHTVGEVFFGRANLSTAGTLTTPDLVVEPGKPNYDVTTIRDLLFESPGDLDGDGRADFALADTFGGFARVYRGQALLPAQASGSGGPVTVPADDFELPLANPTAGTTPTGTPPGLNVASGGATPDIRDAFNLNGGLAGERLGAARPAGDLNGDGVADIVVGGAKHDYVILGPASLTGSVDVRARASVAIDRTASLFAAQRMDDVDGDGVDDLIYYYAAKRTNTTAQRFDLTVAVIKGGPAMPRNPTLADATYKVTFDAGMLFSSFSSSDGLRNFTVAALNFNGDAYADLVVVPQGPLVMVDREAAYVISGATLIAGDRDLHIGAAGEAGPLLTIMQDDTDRLAVQTSTFGPRANGYSGSDGTQALAAVVAGDLNGDGLDDLVFSDRLYATDGTAPAIGRTYVFIGRPDSRLASPATYRMQNAARVYQGVNFAANAVAVGDVNGDGFDDLAVSRTGEGRSRTADSLLFFYGSPAMTFDGNFGGSTPVDASTAASQVLSRKAGDPALQQLEGDLQGAVVVEGTMWATPGDFNGDGKLDLAVGEPDRTVTDTQGTVLDRQQSGRVFIYYAVGARSRGLTTAGADQVIIGGAEFDQLGLLSPTGPIDLNNDFRADLVVGAAGADAFTPSLVAAGGKTYVIYGQGARQATPGGAGIGTLASETYTGDGDFLVGPGTGQPLVFRDFDVNGDGVLDTADYTLAAGQSERWYRFATLGDGQVDSAIRLSNLAREAATSTLRGSDGTLTPTGGVPAYTAAGGASFQVGGGKLAALEFDLRALAGQAAALDQVLLRLEHFANSFTTPGQKLQVFIGRLKGDGFVSGGDGSAAATLAGEYAYAGGATAAGIIQVDVTAAVRTALAAGKTRVMLRVAMSDPSVTLQVHSGSVAGRQTSLGVTTARQHGVVGDVLDATGTAVARGLSAVSMRTFKAGQYFLRVYDPFGAAPRRCRSRST